MHTGFGRSKGVAVAYLRDLIKPTNLMKIRKYVESNPEVTITCAIMEQIIEGSEEH